MIWLIWCFFALTVSSDNIFILLDWLTSLWTVCNISHFQCNSGDFSVAFFPFWNLFFDSFFCWFLNFLKIYIKEAMDKENEPMMIYCFVSICLASPWSRLFACNTQAKCFVCNKQAKQILQYFFNPLYKTSKSSDGRLNHVTQTERKRKTAREIQHCRWWWWWY